MKFSPLLAPLVLLGLAISAPAAVSVLGIAGETNAFIFGEFNAANGYAEGAVVLGGDINSVLYKTYTLPGAPTPTSVLPANTALYVGGNNVSVPKLQVNNGGNAVIGGDQGNLQLNGGGTYTQASYDLAPTIANLTQLSSDLTTFSSVTLNTSGTNIVVDTSLNTANGNLKVYTVDGLSLGAAKNLTFDGTGNETVVINVTGSVMNWGFTVTGGIDTSKILWNFTGDTANIGNAAFAGTLLAPKANVKQNWDITGTVIAKTMDTSNSNLKSKAFTGDIPLVTVPEPAGVMTTGGFLALALFSRRRQTARL